MDEKDREWLIQQRRWLINRMRADQDMVRAIEQYLDLKPMNGRTSEVKAAAAARNR